MIVSRKNIMPLLIVNLLETRDGQEDSSLRDKLEIISKALEKYFGESTEKGLIGVIVAPDYFLCKPDKSITQEDWKIFIAELEKMSGKYPNVLIVPGTGVVEQGILNIKEIESLLEKNLDFLKEHRGKNKTSGKALMEVAQYLSEKLSFIKNQKIEELEGVSNTTAAIYGGKCQFQYRKIVDFYEFGRGMLPFLRDSVKSDSKVRQIFIPGDVVGAFEIDSKKIRIEICADHSAGIAKGNQKELGDISFVLSYGNYLMNSHVPCDDGCLVIELDSKTETVHSTIGTFKIKPPEQQEPGRIGFFNPSMVKADIITGEHDVIVPTKSTLFDMSDKNETFKF